jgi:hypothetical protein
MKSKTHRFSSVSSIGYPKTGRTHQIRVHLKSIGLPILNDVNYGGRSVGNFYGKYVLKSESENYHPKIAEGEIHTPTQPGNEPIAQPENEGKPQAEGEEMPKAEQPILAKRSDGNDKLLDLDAENEIYRYEKFDGTKLMEIFLHSKRYTFEGRVFETEDPYWALPEFDF